MVFERVFDDMWLRYGSLVVPSCKVHFVRVVFNEGAVNVTLNEVGMGW